MRSDRSNRPLPSSSVIWQKLDEYQKEAVEKALEVRTLAVLFDQGTGKTFVAGGWMERLMRPNFSALLIVPFANKNTTWRKFLTTHLPSLEVFEEVDLFSKHSGPKVLLLHIDQLAKKSGAKLVAKVRKHRFTCIVLDEAQRIKQRSSSWSRALAKFKYCSINKMILTGTPMDEQPIDLWAQFRFLRPNCLGTRWADFEEEFLEPLEDEEETLKGVRKGSFRYKRLMRVLMIRRGKRKFDFTKLDRFLERVAPWCTRITQDDLGWEKAVFHKVKVTLGTKQRRIYDDLERNLVLHLPEATITTPLKVVRLEKLRQVCGGYLLDEDHNVHRVGTAKLSALIPLLEEHLPASPVVVFCKYTAEVDAIVDKLMPRYVVAKYSGKVKKKERDAIQSAFQAGKIDVLVCQIKTGGVGLDLFASHIGIMYSPVYSWIDFDQAIKRLKRRGQKRQVHIFLLTATGTIDEDAFGAIVKKRNVTERVLQGIKERNVKWPTRNSVSTTSQSLSVSSLQRRARTSAMPTSSGMARPTNGARTISTRS